MALAISGIPMLTGDEALAFREKAEETLKKRGSIDFSKQRAEMKAILAMDSSIMMLWLMPITCLVNLTAIILRNLRLILYVLLRSQMPVFSRSTCLMRERKRLESIYLI